MWLDLFIAMSCGGAGLACGWVMHATNLDSGIANVPSVAAVTDPTLSANGSDADRLSESTPERISEVADKLKSFASDMAADVDAHQTTVQAVSNQLTSDPSGSPETVIHAITQLVKANELMQSQLQTAQERIHDQAMQIESAERRAETDALTRVPNRGAFDKHLRRQQALGAGRAGTLALLDVDHFKRFNDVYGHRAGDEVLRVVAKILHSRLDQYGIVARFGGEEFAVILDDCSVDRAKELVEAARNAIGAREISFEDKRLRVNASAGVAELMTGEQAEEWLQRADDGLYRSKKAGRNCSHWMDGTTPIKIMTVALGESSVQTASNRTANDKSSTGSADDRADDDSGKTIGKQADVASKPKQNVFARLPDRDEMRDIFDDVRSRTQSTISMYVMAIRCNTPSNTDAMRSLMQLVRATLRSVDRLGSDDGSTFLVLMLCADEATAKSRSQQICRSAAAIGIGKSDSSIHPISIGVSQVDKSDDFENVVERCLELVALAKEVGGEEVRMAPARQTAQTT